MWPAPANSFVLKDDRGAVLIDAGCGYVECYRKIRDFLAGLGLEPGDVHTVVLSHAHPDHMGALPFLLEEASPRIIIHSIERTLAADNRLLNKSFDMCHITDYYMERLGDTDPASIDILDYFSNLCPMGAAEATDTVEEGDTLELGGRRFEVIHTPGHAPGHISLWDREDRTLLSFDLVGAVVAWYCPSGGGAKGYLESLDKIERLGARLILPSHGEDIEDVDGAIARTREVLLSRDRRILEMLGGGPKSLLEVTDALFPEAVRMFPGLQITDSHLIKLEEEGLVERSQEGSMPFFSGVRS
jgi:glyoxylase-like metal-dependent hydrolase (beta-lactamase superfamily II)